jgi:predicted AAA+ superfamily ATPase
MYTRNLYLNRIVPFIDKPVIKIITGMRRTGKSYFLKLIAEHLTKEGVNQSNILFIHLDSLDFEALKTAQDLNLFIQEKTKKLARGKIFLFIDEVQEVSGWEKCVESLFADGRFDLFITGSNAHLLSSELATYLSGRYVEFPIYSLGYQEYLQFMEKEDEPKEESFAAFLKTGGFPALPHFDQDLDVIYQYIGSLYNTILLKDVVKRNNLRNVALLENITRYTFDNIGNIFSAKKIADYLKSQKMSIGVDTVQNYLAQICATFALYKVPRYDIKGKRILEVHEKYYLGDIGLRHALLGYREADISGILENIVFLELKRRGYTVHIGKLDTLGIDFIATRANEKIYLQVAYLLASEETIQREFKPLLLIPDNYPKYVLSMDTLFGNDYEGIQRINLINFLLQKPN